MDASRLLMTSGWAPGRSVDITDDVTELTREGFPPHAAAESFLKEFAGLTLHADGHTNPLIISGVVAAHHAFPGWADAYATAIGLPLVPVGEYSNLTFWIDSTGGIWASFDDAYGYVGASLRDMLHGLFFESPGWHLDRLVDPE